MFDMRPNTLYTVRIEFSDGNGEVLTISDVVDYSYGEFMVFLTVTGQAHMIASGSIRSIFIKPTGDYND